MATAYHTITIEETGETFRCPEHRTLLVTAGSGVYSLESPLPGFPY